MGGVREPWWDELPGDVWVGLVRANPNQSNRVQPVSHGGYLRARVGQVAWGCVGGAEARANPNQSNRVQLVGRV